MKVTLLRPACPASLVRITLAGQKMRGFSVSATVTVKTHCVALPRLSVAVQVTRLVPSGKVEPLGGRQTTTGTEQLSVAVTVKVTLLREQSPALALRRMLVEQVGTGGVWSATTTTLVE